MPVDYPQIVLTRWRIKLRMHFTQTERKTMILCWWFVNDQLRLRVLRYPTRSQRNDAWPEVVKCVNAFTLD